MKPIFFCLLLGLSACNQPASQSVYPDIVAGEAIRLADEQCQYWGTNLDWLRNRIDSLEIAPYHHQQFIYLIKEGRSTFFAIGPAKLSRISSPVFDCEGRTHKLAGAKKLTSTIIYTPPAHRRQGSNF
ncbi:hypothetical protein LC612_38720 [Nostoc sp. CHAB 5834]|nr:hypothetical protein [Nostoc sp. CHAB 5834]